MRARQSLFPILLVALMVGLGVQACAPVGVLSHPGGAILQVDNRNFADMNVYAISEDGFPRRLGTAGGLRSSTFALPYDTFATGAVSIVGVPIGGFGAAGSGAVSVHSGETLEFTIEQNLNLSSVMLR